MNIYLDKNPLRPKGLAVRFPYHPDGVTYIKNVLGLEWNKNHKAWVSDGPEVLLDLQRFNIKISDMSSAARLIAEEFRQELWDIMDIRSEDSEELYAYQRQGSSVLAKSPRFLLGDVMGIGKTKQALDAIASLDLQQVLVLCPKTLTYNWLDEVQKWHPEISAGVVPDKRKPSSKKDDKGDDRITFWSKQPRITIANYEKLLVSDWPLARHWDLVVADEAQRLKNSTTIVWKHTRVITRQSDRFWAMTGTPLEIRLMELYNIFSLMRPSVLGGFWRFKNQHMITDWGGNVVGARNIELLRERIGPFMLRRTKSEVLKQLPPKIFTQSFIKMSPAEQRDYQNLLMDFDQWLRDKDVSGSSDPMVKTIRMRQFCCSPHLFTPDAPRGSKYETLVELLEDHDGRTVIFCEFEQMTRLLALWLKEDVGYNPEAYISGDVKAQDRISRVKAFNEGKLGDVFISTDAGREGINLTGADLVVHYNQLWNPQRMHQREDRTHRIGQKLSVTVVDLLLIDTVDVGMYELNREREQLFTSVIEEAEEAMIRKLSPARLRRILEGRLDER